MSRGLENGLADVFAYAKISDVFVPSNEPMLAHGLDSDYVDLIVHRRIYAHVPRMGEGLDPYFILLFIDIILSDSMVYPPCEAHDNEQFRALTHDGYPWKVHVLYDAEIEWEETCSLSSLFIIA